MGDLGNIEANAEGVATFDAVFPAVDMGMITGRGLIVHAGEDDLVSQPTGAAGARLGCGVIGVANAPTE
jgi:Cu/Zn superoxide dismutase